MHSEGMCVKNDDKFMADSIGRLIPWNSVWNSCSSPQLRFVPASHRSLHHYSFLMFSCNLISALLSQREHGAARSKIQTSLTAAFWSSSTKSLKSFFFFFPGTLELLNCPEINSSMNYADYIIRKTKTI